MQENEFESTVSKKMEELEIVPAAAVWEKVSANIRNEKRKRRFFIFLTGLIFFIALGGFYFYHNSVSRESLITANNTTSPGKFENKEGRDRTKDNNNKQVTALSYKVRSANLQKQRGKTKQYSVPVNNNIKLAGYKKNNEAELVFTSSPATVSSVKNKKDDEELKKNLSRDNEEKETYKANLPLRTTASNGPALPRSVTDETGSIRENPANKSIAEAKKDSSQPFALSGNKPVKKPGSKSNNKWNIGFTVFSGVSNNLSQLRLFAGSNAYAFSSAAGSTGSSSALITRLTYKSRLSYGFGLFTRKRLNRTAGFTAGVNYHFLSAASFVGGENKANRTFYDAALQSTARVNEYYPAGQSEEYTNKYHLVEMPLNVLLRLNKNENKPLFFTAGISPAYLFATKALYANYDQNVYYTDNTQFKKLQLSAQTGIQYTILNSPHFALTAGPQVQYSFNNMARSVTATSQHLFSGMLKANITLK